MKHLTIIPIAAGGAVCAVAIPLFAVLSDTDLSGHRSPHPATAPDPEWLRDRHGRWVDDAPAKPGVSPSSVASPGPERARDVPKMRDRDAGTAGRGRPGRAPRAGVPAATTGTGTAGGPVAGGGQPGGTVASSGTPAIAPAPTAPEPAPAPAPAPSPTPTAQAPSPAPTTSAPLIPPILPSVILELTTIVPRP